MPLFAPDGSPIDPSLYGDPSALAAAGISPNSQSRRTGYRPSYLGSRTAMGFSFLSYMPKEPNTIDEILNKTKPQNAMSVENFFAKTPKNRSRQKNRARMDALINRTPT